MFSWVIDFGKTAALSRKQSPMLSFVIPGGRRIQRAKPNAAGLTLLNLGCGARRHPAWTNTDLAPTGADVLSVDLRKRLPFPDQEFDAVYASHVLEHLTPQEAKQLLVEVRRVLRAGGIARLVVPDLEGIVRDYLAALDAVDRGDDEARWQHRWMTIELLDQLVRTCAGGTMARWWSCNPVPAHDFIRKRLGVQATAAIEALHAQQTATGEPSLHPKEILHTPQVSDRRALRFSKSGERHKWMYDRISLCELLSATGFCDPRRVTALESRITDFPAYELDADRNGTTHKPDSLFMEAVAPPSFP